MCYAPEDMYIIDAWTYPYKGQLHCIYLQTGRPGGKNMGDRIGALGHAVSDDLIHWRQMPDALSKGAAGSYDDADIWTGCTFEESGKLYMYYTARSTREHAAVNRLALAVSENGTDFKRFEGNPILTPDARWYYNEQNPIKTYGHGHFIVDCRDLCVVRDPDGNGYWGYFAARRHASTNASSSCIALCHSMDLIHWEQHPPCFMPQYLGCVEVPDVFFLNGKWYMLCLTGSRYGHHGNLGDPLLREGTVYAVAEHPWGPFEMPEDRPVLIGSLGPQGYSVKTCAFKGQRIAFYTQGQYKLGSPHGKLSLPLLLKTDADGRLFAAYHPAIENQLVKGELGKTLGVGQGIWGSIGTWEQAGDGVCGTCLEDWAILPYEASVEEGELSAYITVESGKCAGLCFGLSEDNVMGGSLAVLLDVEAGQVEFTALREFPLLEKRRWRIQKGCRYHLRVVMDDQNYMVYVDDELVLQGMEPGRIRGKAALFVEHGTALFTGVSYKKWKEWHLE